MDVNVRTKNEQMNKQTVRQNLYSTDHVGLAQACPNYKYSYVQIRQAISTEPNKIGMKILETLL